MTFLCDTLSLHTIDTELFYSFNLPSLSHHLSDECSICCQELPLMYHPIQAPSVLPEQPIAPQYHPPCTECPVYSQELNKVNWVVFSAPKKEQGVLYRPLPPHCEHWLCFVCGWLVKQLKSWRGQISAVNSRTPLQWAADLAQYPLPWKLPVTIVPQQIH